MALYGTSQDTLVGRALGTLSYMHPLCTLHQGPVTCSSCLNGTRYLNIGLGSTSNQGGCGVQGARWPRGHLGHCPGPVRHQGLVQEYGLKQGHITVQAILQGPKTRTRLYYGYPGTTPPWLYYGYQELRLPVSIQGTR